MSNCERVNDKIIDRVTGNLGDAEGRELDAHLGECETCRSELHRMESMWSALAQVDIPAAASTGPALSADPLPVRAGHWQRTGLIAATLVVGLLGGYAAGSSRGEPIVDLPERVMVGPDEPAGYLALLRQDGPFLGPDVPPEPMLVEEYGKWAEELASEDRLIASARLDDFDKVFMGPNEQIDNEDLGIAPHISGYFLITAANFEEAKFTVASMPHLRYGGWVELREVVR